MNIEYFGNFYLQLIESYKKVWAAKQKRRPLTKQEKNEIYTLAEEQKRLADELEAMPVPGFNATVCRTQKLNELAKSQQN